jgi:hypothetical protein
MTAPTAPAPERAALWEDFLEIFTRPSAVFERRKNAGFLLPFLVLVVVFVVLYLGLRGAFQPIIDAEISRQLAKAMAKNPQMTEEGLAAGRAMADKFALVGPLVGFPVTVLLVGLVTWAAGRVIGAAVTVGAAMMIATYSYFPKLLGTIVGGAMALLLPAEQLNGSSSISVGPAHFLNPDTASPLVMGLLVRLDLFTLWVTFLLAVGLRVVGKIPMNKALLGAAIIWIVGAVPALAGAVVGGG